MFVQWLASNPAADANHQIPQVTDVRDLGVPLDTTFTLSVRCREAANAARQLPFTIRRSFMDISKAAFIPVYCAIMQRTWSMHWKPTPRPWGLTLTNWSGPMGLQHDYWEIFVTWHCQPNLFSLESRCLRADLILVFKISKSKVDLSPSDFFLHNHEPG